MTPAWSLAVSCLVAALAVAMVSLTSMAPSATSAAQLTGQTVAGHAASANEVSPSAAPVTASPSPEASPAASTDSALTIDGAQSVSGLLPERPSRSGGAVPLWALGGLLAGAAAWSLARRRQAGHVSARGGRHL